MNRVNPSSNPSTPRGSSTSTSPVPCRPLLLSRTGEKGDCCNCPATSRVCRRTSPRLSGAVVPMKACGNPPAFPLSTSGNSRPGPHRCAAVDTPTATRGSSSDSVLLPASRRPYGVSPKRCGASIAYGNLASPKRSESRPPLAASSNGWFCAQKSTGATCRRRRQSDSTAPPRSSPVMPRPVHAGPGPLPLGYWLLKVRRAPGRSHRNDASRRVLSAPHRRRHGCALSAANPCLPRSGRDDNG